jgi:hypothetical protein
MGGHQEIKQMLEGSLLKEKVQVRRKKRSAADVQFSYPEADQIVGL